MSDEILKKLNSIEMLLIQLNDKIDNFLEFKELTESEKTELNAIKQEIKEGKTKLEGREYNGNK